MTVVVVGGGAVGLASALYLADRGADVTLLDRGTIGAENSVRTGGGIRLQFGTRINVRLSQESVPAFETFGAVGWIVDTQSVSSRRSRIP